MESYLLIDRSRSMCEDFDRAGIRRIDAVRDTLNTSLSHYLRSGAFTLAFFNGEVDLVLRSESRDKVIEAFDSYIENNQPEGTTCIWDSLIELLDGVDKNESSRIICITDGDDRESSLSFEEIEKQLKQNDNTALTIIDLIGNLTLNISSQDLTIRQALNSNELQDAIEKALGIQQECADKIRSESVDRSVAVFPLIDVTEEEFGYVNDAVQTAAQYIEEQTNLIYYPVPTLIVDEYTIHEARNEPKLQRNRVDPDLEEDILEILHFLEAVCLSFHTGRINPRETTIGDDFYGLYCSLPAETRQKLVFGIETITFTIRNFIMGDPAYRNGVLRSEESDWERWLFIPELSLSKDFYNVLYDDFYEVLKIMQRMAEAHPQQIVLSDKYFVDTRRDGSDLKREPADLNAWKKHLSKEESRVIRKCLSRDGMWKKDLESINIGFEISVNLLFHLFRKSNLLKSVFQPLIETFHTYGVYLPPSGERPEKLKNLLLAKGFPCWFTMKDSGIVIISLDRCRDKIDQCAQKTNIPNKELLLKDFILAIAIHEHTHAAVREGIPIIHHRNGLSGKGFDPEERSRGSCDWPTEVDESLAEWCSLSYFLEASMIYRIIRQHALLGDYPEWPYRGAFFFDKKDPNESLLSFQTAMRYLRESPSKAANLIRIV